MTTAPTTTPAPNIDPDDTLCHHEFRTGGLCADDALPDTLYCPSHQCAEGEPFELPESPDVLPAPRRARRFTRRAPAASRPSSGAPSPDHMRGTSTDDLADALIDLGRLAMLFGRIDRTAVYHPDGVTPESDTDHTVMVGWLACALAAHCFPWLNLGLVAQFALVHDAPEVYAGDTPTLRIDAAGRAAKAAREHAAVLRLTSEFGQRLPWFVEIVTVYEAQQVPEARFVRGLDKLVPKIVHLLDGATGLVEQGMSRGELAEVFADQRSAMNSYVGEFTELMALNSSLGAQVFALPALAGGDLVESAGGTR